MAVDASRATPLQPFLHAHAAHPDWRLALGMVVAQLDGALAGRPAPTLGWCYFTDFHAPAAESLLAALQEHYDGCAWVGAVGVGICADGVEYFDEPALAVMLAPLPAADFRVFSGQRPLPGPEHGDGFVPQTALVHADPGTSDLAELIDELSQRTGSGYLFGGLASSRTRTLTIADGVFEGGLSGVAFSPDVALVSRVTQGCQPVGPSRRVTEVERNVVYALDGEPALDCLLRDLGVDERVPREALPKLRSTLAGLSDAATAPLADAARPSDADTGPGAAAALQTAAFTARARSDSFGAETRVRHLVGLDPQRRGVAIGDVASEGQQLAFCRRDLDAARRDLVRIAAEIRSTLEPDELPLTDAAGPATGGRRIVGALYVSCTGRGGPHFGAPSAELQLLRHALGGGSEAPIPLVGFFAAGEIGHRHLYGYTGVLTVFTAPVDAAEPHRPAGVAPP